MPIIDQLQVKIKGLQEQVAARRGQLLGGRLGASSNPGNNLAGGIVEKARSRIAEMQSRLQQMRPGAIRPGGLLARGPVAPPAPVRARGGGGVALEQPAVPKAPTLPPKEVKLF